MQIYDSDIFFDLEDVNRIEEIEIAFEPDEIEAESAPDIRDFTPQEIARMFERYRDMIEGEVRYRLSLYAGSHLLFDFEDLVHEGFLGFLKGARKHDESKGASLQTYARYWVRKYVRKAVEDAVLNYRYLDYEIDGDKTEWRTGVTVSEAEFTYENDFYRTNAKLPVYDSNPESICSHRDKKLRVRHAVNAATVREKAYMDYRFGFDGDDGHSFGECREHFGLHGQRGADMEFGLRYDTEQRLGYGFFDYAQEYWMPHSSDKTDFKWQRVVPSLENMPDLP